MCCRFSLRRAQAAPTLAWSLIAEPVDPAVDAERLVYRQRYAELYQHLLSDGVAQGPCHCRILPSVPLLWWVPSPKPGWAAFRAVAESQPGGIPDPILSACGGCRRRVDADSSAANPDGVAITGELT